MERIIEGKSGIGPLTRVNADEYPAKVAAQVNDFDRKLLWIEKTRENGSFYSVCGCSSIDGR